MTIAVNGQEDVLTQQELWDFCRVHGELGLVSDELGRLAFDLPPDDPAALAAEVQACLAHEPRLTAAGQRLLQALQA